MAEKLQLGQSRVEIFWNDLLNFSSRYPDKNIADQEYFLGALVIADAGGKQMLLDGQQRLATATVLLSVIRDFLKEYKADAAGRVQQRYIAGIDDATNTTNPFWSRMSVGPRWVQNSGELGQKLIRCGSKGNTFNETDR